MKDALLLIAVALGAFFVGFLFGREYESNQNTVRIEGKDWHWEISGPKEK